NTSSHNKFSFDLYKSEYWSVEHINPQNPKDFKSVGQVVKWLDSYKNYYTKNYNEDKNIVDEITDLFNLLNHSENKNRKLSELRLSKENSEKLQSVTEKITNDLELHNITNLALLDRSTNSKLGNNVFIDKRKIILDLYYAANAKDVFILKCTKDVFTKNFSKENENISDEFFVPRDMIDYKEHLKKQLDFYYQ